MLLTTMFHPSVHFVGLLTEIHGPGTALLIFSTTALLLITCYSSGHWTRALVPPPLDINSPYFKNLYWYGQDGTNIDLASTLCIVMDIFKFTLWKSKLRRCLPNIITLSREISFIIDVACTANASFRHNSGNINMISNLFQARG